MFNKSKNPPPPTVVSLDRDKLTFCGDKATTILTFPYPQGTVNDLEITNHELLATQLSNFLASHKITPTNLVFVLAPSIYFDRDLTHFSDQDRSVETRKFLDMIPFGSVSSKLFHIGNDYKLVAINRDFYESIKVAFEKLGFTVRAVVPNFVLNALGLKDGFNIEACHLILRKMDYVMENSFLTEDGQEATLAVSRHFIQKHQAVFAVLSFLFVGLAATTAFFTLRRPTPPRPVSAYVTPPTTIELPPTSTPIPEATPASSLSVQITNASEVVGLSSELVKELKLLGYVDISTNQASVSAIQTLVVYSPRVSNSLRDRLADSFEKFFNTVSFSENPSTQYDINITVGPPK